jgi:uncharacterized protein YjlB
VNRSVKITPPSLDSNRPTNRLTVEPLMFEASDWVPNHPKLPVLVYRSALDQEPDPAAEFEAGFSRNGWQGIWRNGVFDYHHYHSGAHEVLGIGAGRARLMIGGPSGLEISVNAGDCLVLPAGTGHMRIDASRDFLVVGAYPPGQDADICTSAPSEKQRARIEALARPQTDPLEGAGGALLRFWSA